MYQQIRLQKKGFTLIEVIVVVGIIALLASVVLFSVSEARKQTRDNKRKADLKQLQLAIELYAQENGKFPARGCGVTTNNVWTGPGPATSGSLSSCDDYIAGIVPKYLERLPVDPNQEDTTNRGYYYLTNANRDEYKVLVYGTVEELEVAAKGDELARRQPACTAEHEPITYAIYHDSLPGNGFGYECF